MDMHYQVLSVEAPEEWIIRVYCGHLLCGKIRLDTTTKDELKAKLDELGWTERT